MKTRNLIIFAMLSTLLVLTSFSEYGTTCQAQETELYPIRVNGKEGYIDATGQVVIKPQFDYASYFYEGLASVVIDGKFGFINKSGKFVISPQFDVAKDFSEGLAIIWKGHEISSNKNIGYIDKTGKIVISPQFDWANNFSEGLAAVRVGDYDNGKWGFIDKTGRFVINPQFARASNFSGGIAAVFVGVFGDGKWGYIDKTGKVLFDFFHVYDFSEGLAHVSQKDKEGYIDKTGNFVINIQAHSFGAHEFYGDFKEGLAQVGTFNFTDDYKQCNYKVGFIDKTGRLVINLQFDKVEDFSDGFSCVRIGGKYGIGRYGYIDKTGSYVINPQFDYAESFRGGIAPVVINDQFHYIDKKGSIIWDNTEVPTYIKNNIGDLKTQEDHIRK